MKTMPPVRLTVAEA